MAVLAAIAHAEGRGSGDVARSVEALARAKGGPLVMPQDKSAALRTVRERLEAALDASIDRCARCKVCDVQIGAVMAVIEERGDRPDGSSSSSPSPGCAPWRSGKAASR